MDYQSAYDLSRKFLMLLTPVCVRIEVVGSVKRADPRALQNGVHDIEFLLIPDPARVAPVFGAGRDQPRNKLERLLADMKADRLLAEPTRKADGERYKKFTIIDSGETDELGSPKEFHLELFIVSARTWAIQNVIRTGPSAFSQRFVTNESKSCFHKPSGKLYKGLLPDYYQYVREETIIRVRNTGQALELAEEADAIKLLGLRQDANYWIPPDERYLYT